MPPLEPEIGQMILDAVLRAEQQPVATAQTALQQLLGQTVQQAQPERISLADTILGALSGGLQAHSAALQGRPTGPTALDRLRDRRLRQAQTETALRVQQRGERVQTAREGVRAARRGQEIAEERRIRGAERAEDRLIRREELDIRRRERLTERAQSIADSAAQTGVTIPSELTARMNAGDDAAFGEANNLIGSEVRRRIDAAAAELDSRSQTALANANAAANVLVDGADAQGNPVGPDTAADQIVVPSVRMRLEAGETPDQIIADFERRELDTLPGLNASARKLAIDRARAEIGKIQSDILLEVERARQSVTRNPFAFSQRGDVVTAAEKEAFVDPTAGLLEILDRAQAASLRPLPSRGAFKP